jgi:hypothetical protein
MKNAVDPLHDGKVSVAGVTLLTVQSNPVLSIRVILLSEREVTGSVQ